MVDMLATDLVTRDEKVAYVADLFIQKFSYRPAPIQSLQGALYGAEEPVGDTKIIILEAAVQAANELWLTRRLDARDLADAAIDQALRLIRSNISTDDLGLTYVIQRALPLIGRR